MYSDGNMVKHPKYIYLYNTTNTYRDILQYYLSILVFIELENTRLVQFLSRVTLDISRAWKLRVLHTLHVVYSGEQFLLILCILTC